MSVLGAGFVVGALFLSRLSTDKFKTDSLPRIFSMIGISIVAIGIIAFFDQLPVILFAVPVFVIGYCIVNASINWKTFIQINTPSEKLGRVASISALVGDITLPIAFAFYGFLLEQINFVLLTVLSGVLLITSVYLIQLRFRKRITNISPVRNSR